MALVARIATEKQIAYLESLLEQHEVDSQTVAGIRAEIKTGRLDRKAASTVIDYIKELPRKTSAPAAGPAASDKQVAYITSLLDQREVGANVESAAREAIAQGKLDRKSASALIDHLQDLPRRTVRRSETDIIVTQGEVRTVEIEGGQKVPAGRYALHTDDDRHTNDISFYRVWISYGGAWGIDQIITDGRIPVRNRRKILELIAADPQSAAALYGHEIGSCGVCGRTLTNDESRERGIGPVCAGKVGW